ncbi:ATP-binding protein [Anoxynatronum buryatiense]|uniref:Circadian input-output histidine kinase CikA n=1 Tax=Anoxynatronum buryatiense TaxID=489973 RepID=A0AA45WV06_9CLOT|nr:ATP-binding protein [Anoxynatronum buryatiense]SMP51162.1 PAS domain S-box-containing protein [Anoxynatronum buryatiense]
MTTENQKTNEKDKGVDQRLREQAEELIRGRPVGVAAEDASPLPREISETLHELQVHQIELEIQNEELRTMQAELITSRERYFDLYDLAPVGYCTLSEEGLILETNLTAANLLGTSRKEMVQRPFTSFILKEDQDVYYFHRKEVLETKQSQECELRLVCSGESPFWAHLTTVVAADVDGVTVWRVILEEITVRKKAEMEMIKAKEEAEAANAVKSQFLVNMSHEIRTPLNGLTGMLQLLEMTPLSDEQKEYVKISRTTSDVLIKVITDILDYSQIEAGKIELETIDFELKRVVQEAADVFRVAAAKKDLQIHLHDGGELPLLRGDPFRIRQVLSNLIGNAVKFTHAGTITVRVKPIDIKNTRQIKLEFAVKDTGIGISSHQRHVLFQSFSQADLSTTRQYGGSGLGLSICQGLVEKMGGAIWFESQEGVGSSFYFTCILEKSMTDTLQCPSLR